MFKPDLCSVCGYCLERCHYLHMKQDEAIREFHKLIDGEPSRVISDCVSCMACDEICPEKANPFSLILKRQEEQKEIERFPLGRQMYE